jgi:hypothetical protein
MPSWIAPHRFGRPASAAVESEGCGIADTLMLAVQLTNAGLGDYWDDVDAIVRNHLSEMQITDLAAMRRACGSAAYDMLLQQFVGGFTQAELTANLHASVNGCCTGNGVRALYHAWEGITRFADGIATVNLLLNRATPWLDVESHLPYAGKVVLQNKQAQTVLVRIPYWVDRQALTCSIMQWAQSAINEAASAGVFVGNYLVFQPLQPGDTVLVEFPIGEVVEQYTIGSTIYTATIRGSTVVDIHPRATARAGLHHQHPFFVRDHLRASTAPIKSMRRFVAAALPTKI